MEGNSKDYRDQIIVDKRTFDEFDKWRQNKNNEYSIVMLDPDIFYKGYDCEYPYPPENTLYRIVFSCTGSDDKFTEFNDFIEKWNGSMTSDYISAVNKRAEYIDKSAPLRMGFFQLIKWWFKNKE